MIKMHVGIKDGKIYDICSDLRHKRDSSINDNDYLDVKNNDSCIDDTWNFEKNESLKDSPFRFIEPEPTELELLEKRIQKLEDLVLKLTE